MAEGRGLDQRATLARMLSKEIRTTFGGLRSRQSWACLLPCLLGNTHRNRDSQFLNREAVPHLLVLGVWGWMDGTVNTIHCPIHKWCKGAICEHDPHTSHLTKAHFNGSLMVSGCISACEIARSNIWQGTINAGRCIAVTYAPILMTSFLGRACIFQRDNAKLHMESIPTAWLHSRRVWVLHWSACTENMK